MVTLLEVFNQSITDMSEIVLLTKAEVIKRLSISERSLEKLVKACKFPPPLRIGKQAQWVDSVVHKWLEQKVAKQLAWEPPKRRPSQA
jgi:predicted DNA-binding transcriptional regulator AlpA